MSDEIYSITLTRFRRPSIIVCLPSPPNLRNRVYIVYKSRKFASNLFSSTFFLYIHIETIKNYLSISHLHLSL